MQFRHILAGRAVINLHVQPMAYNQYKNMARLKDCGLPLNDWQPAIPGVAVATIRFSKI